MKTLMVSIASLLLLISFPLQSMLDMAHASRNNVAQSIVQSYAAKARLEGCFTETLDDAMAQDLANALPGIAPTDVLITTTKIPKYRTATYNANELISYSVEIPVTQRFIGGVIFGEHQDARYYYTIAGSVASERLP
jgi:hypothetical protein